MQIKIQPGPASHSHSALLSALARPIQKPKQHHYQLDSTTAVINDKKLEAIRQLFDKATVTTNAHSQPQVVPFKNYHKLNLNWSNNVTNKQQQSPPVLISADTKSICLHPSGLGYFETHAGRLHKPLRVNAFTYWQIRMDTSACSGTSVMIGVGQRNTPLVLNGYTDMLGVDATSWGLSTKGYLLHGGRRTIGFCEPLAELETHTIGCLFDGYRGSLAFYVDGQFKGVAFRQIPLNKRNDAELDLFPMVASTVSNSVFTCEFSYESFPSLQELSAAVVKREEGYFGSGYLERSVFSRFFSST
jgi:hypothetical protein